MMPTVSSAKPPFALRDLQWVITSPFLLKDRAEPELAHHPETALLLEWLAMDPEPLLAHLAAAPRLNLGRYFEQLVIFWLKNLPSVEIIGSNIRIYREKRSLGELDLVFTQNGKAYHWELAVKFYLNIGSGQEEADFVGPLQKDNLARKLHRMYDHQLALPTRPETREILNTLGIGDITSHPWVKGRLFHPLGAGDRHLPPRVAGDSLSGNWLTISELANTRFQRINRFLPLEKKRWITPEFYAGETAEGGPGDLADHLMRQFLSRPAPELVALSNGSRTERCFIVPDGWPVLSRKADDGQEAGN
ncbi:DUF1853 family protein [uncultured Sneathiella sp.]|jgi:hypothetical protein|uniref:DUF1853 family protein n=2 Tax=uncultured Sneathiella sp. TaxID=879315 RepID=UPI0030DB1CA8|tara:strand:+ start:8994 stop:9908 length:915 start_codon:yes stop_codon:yes gene_type:complete